MELWCERGDGSRHGAWRRFVVDDDGDIDRKEGEFRKGRRHGVWTWTARNGFLARSVYRDGQRHGTATDWWRGHRSRESQYEDGYRHGAILGRPPQQQLWDGMRSIRPQMAACAEEHGFTGGLGLAVVVYPTGRFSWANLRTDIEEFRGCVSRALKTLEFARTEAGFTFYYA